MNRLKEINRKLNNGFWRAMLAENQILKTVYSREMNNARQSNIYKTNANYRAMHTKVNTRLANAMKSENRPSIRYRKQQGGTCWFHSIVNGLLMSERPRTILTNMSENVPSDNRQRNFQLCPMRSAPPILFWRYIRHRLERYGGVNLAFKNQNVIRSSGIRGVEHRVRTFIKKGLRAAMTRDNYEGGTKHDVFAFYRKMFPRGLFVIKEYDGDTPIPLSLSTGYTLTHADVSVWQMPETTTSSNTVTLEGHAIAGYLTPTGKYKMYDSASDRVIDYNWTRPTSKYWDESIILVKTIAVYTRNE